MYLYFKKTDLEIYIQNRKHHFDLNVDLEVASIRDSFNASVGKLSENNNTVAYWLMRLSERNTLVNDLFLDLCRVFLIKSLMEKHKDVHVYTNNVTLYTFFSKENVSFKNRTFFEIKRNFSCFRPFATALKFLTTQCFYLIRYRRSCNIRELKDITIIQTWVADTNFEKGSFRDSYYQNLSSYLQYRGRKVLTWPVFYNVRKRSRAIECMRKCPGQFIVLEDYLKVVDYFSAILHFLKKRYMDLGKISVDGEDFTNVFKYYQKKETVEFVSLFLSFAKRLSESGSSNLTFIQNHENMISEKALILGVQKYLKNSYVFGYFHTTKPRNLLCLEYATSQEYEIAPKPHTVIFNSFKYRQYFEKRLIHTYCKDGVAFKQYDRIKISDLSSNHSDKKILVIFSGTATDVQLMCGFLNALKEDYKFIFRMHPLNRFDVSKYYHKDNYIVENDASLSFLASEASRVISTYSALALELALCGVFVGLIYNKKKLLINPFDDTDVQNYQLISDSASLERFLRKNFPRANVDYIFNTDDKLYQAFV